MKITEIANLLSARIRTCEKQTERDVVTAYAGDMLSDVLALGKQPDILLTGLLNPQVIRTAEMLDTVCVVFLRGKEPGGAILELAEKCGVCVLTTSLDMYKACGDLFRNGVTAAE